METAESLKTSKVWLKGFDTVIRWFLRSIQIEIYIITNLIGIQQKQTKANTILVKSRST